MIMRLYRKFLILKLSPMPQPKQVRISLIMEDLVMSASSLPHVFKIFFTYFVNRLFIHRLKRVRSFALLNLRFL